MSGDKIELRMNFDDVEKLDLSDPSKLTEKDFQKIWTRDCFNWHGRLLTGEKCHYCPDWDFLAIDETCPEYEACCCRIGEKE